MGKIPEKLGTVIMPGNIIVSSNFNSVSGRKCQFMMFESMLLCAFSCPPLHKPAHLLFSVVVCTVCFALCPLWSHRVTHCGATGRHNVRVWLHAMYSLPVVTHATADVLQYCRPNTPLFELRRHWMWVSWSNGCEKSVGPGYQMGVRCIKRPTHKPLDNLKRGSFRNTKRTYKGHETHSAVQWVTSNKF